MRGCSYPERFLSELEPTVTEGASPPVVPYSDWAMSAELAISATIEGINAATRPLTADPTRLAGIPVGPTVESTNAIIRQVWALERDGAQRQMRRDMQNSMYGFNRNPPVPEATDNTGWVMTERETGSVPGYELRPICTTINQHVLPQGTTPQRLAKEEAKLLRAMNKV